MGPDIALSSSLEGTLNILLACILPFLLTYCFTYLSCKSRLLDHKTEKKPPVAPYWIPFVGHLGSFLRDPANLFLTLSRKFGGTIPLCVYVLGQELYLISGPSSIKFIWGNSETFTPKKIQLMGMRNALKLGPNGAKFCESDNSGRGVRPHPKSSVKPENRIWFLTHNSAAVFLSGSYLQIMALHFQHHLRHRLHAFSPRQEWVEKTDLYSFIYGMIFTTQIEVLFGKYFLLLNPDFTSDFREFHNGIPSLLRAYPSWMIPKAWHARERCLKSIKRWHKYRLKLEKNDAKIFNIERHLFYGSDYIEERKRIHTAMEPLDEDAIASSELGVIWAASSNIIATVFWYAVELIANPKLLSNIRAEVEVSIDPDPKSPESIIDIEKLSTQPYIQSAYAEVLRLRTYNLLVTTPDYDDFNFRNWIFPKEKLVAISSHTAHMDSRTWNTGSVGAEHPLGTFWAERFLSYPSDPSSGPLKPELLPRRRSILSQKQDHFQDDASIKGSKLGAMSTSAISPQFSLKGLCGIWAPFGGGYSLCPGRHLAKKEILLSVALLMKTFDFEFVKGKNAWNRLRRGSRERRDIKPEMRYFGTGVLPPKEEVLVVIKRRIAYAN